MAAYCLSCFRATFWKKPSRVTGGWRSRVGLCQKPPESHGYRMKWVLSEKAVVGESTGLWPGRKACCIRIRGPKKKVSAGIWQQSSVDSLDYHHPVPVNSALGLCSRPRLLLFQHRRTEADKVPILSSSWQASFPPHGIAFHPHRPDSTFLLLGCQV